KVFEGNLQTFFRLLSFSRLLSAVAAGILLLTRQLYIRKYQVVAQVPHVVVLINIEAHMLYAIRGLLRDISPGSSVVDQTIRGVILEQSELSVTRNHINAILLGKRDRRQV